MKLKTLFAALIFVAASSGTDAQIKDYKDVPNIEVTGTARMDIMPDEIYVFINLRERADGKDKISVEEQDKQLKKGLMDLAIDLENLTLSDSESDYVRISWRRKEVITTKSYSLKLATAKEVSEVFKKLDEIKIHDAYISRTEHSQIVELRKQLRIDAIKAAKEKADYLLNAIGEEAGHALEIRENQDNYYGNRYMLNNIQTMSESNFGAERDEELIPEIGFKKIRLEASIYVKFEIKQ